MLKVFKTVDTGVAYLESIGCKWSYEKEKTIRKDHGFEYNGTTVLIDEHGILD